MTRDEIAAALEALARELRRGRIVTLSPMMADYLAAVVRRSPNLPPFPESQ